MSTPTARPARLLGFLAGASILLGACGGTALPAPATAAATTPALSAPTASAAPVSAGGIWTIGPRSKATVRVREQLVNVPAPSDAVLVATGANGTFRLKPDGSFSDDSKISFDLNTLVSDQSFRDGFVKRTTLETAKFPTADLVPVKATGLSVPLPASGDFTFKLAAKLTIHGVTKDVTFDVVAKRTGSDLTATATLNPTIKFADFGMSPPSVPGRVISVVDEIKLVVDLVATGPAT